MRNREDLMYCLV